MGAGLPERDWLLERELTGAHTWLTGSAAQARAEGFQLRDAAPTGLFRGRHGDFSAARSDGPGGEQHAPPSPGGGLPGPPPPAPR